MLHVLKNAHTFRHACVTANPTHMYAHKQISFFSNPTQSLTGASQEKAQNP